MNKERRYELDWIRVIVFDLLILYHVGMLFVPWGYHVKNNVTHQGFVIPMMFLNQWRLPILFIISGMGTRFALSFRSGKKYIQERVIRLLIPLIFGMFFIVSPQVYLERLSQGADYTSFFDFYPDYFNGIYPTGNFSWHHLWFLPYLFFYSLVFTPLFLYIRNNPDLKLLAWFKFIIEKYPFALYFFTIPLIILESVLKPLFPTTLAFWGDWYIMAFYAMFFLYGFILISVKDMLWVILEKRKIHFFSLSIFFTILLLVSWQTDMNFYFLTVIRIFNIWSWILTIFGFALKYLNKPGKFLTYRNKAVYPFYILHQTILLFLGYYLKDLHIHILLKFIIVIIGTFLICWLIYELIILKIKIIQPLFGLKKIKTSYYCQEIMCLR